MLVFELGLRQICSDCDMHQPLFSPQATILRLAVKYQLHPLPVEDTMQLLD